MNGVLAEVRVWKDKITRNEAKHLESQLDGSVYGLLCLYLPLNEGRGSTIYDHSIRQQFYQKSYPHYSAASFTIKWRDMTASPLQLPVGDFLTNDPNHPREREYYGFDGVTANEIDINMHSQLDETKATLVSFWVYPIECSSLCIIFKIDSFGLTLIRNRGGWPPYRL